MSVLFGWLRTFFEQAFHTRQPNPWRRHLLGGACTAVVAITVTYSAEYVDSRQALNVASGEADTWRSND